MKKQLKKWLAILVAGAMVFALPLAVAADGADYSPSAYDDVGDGEAGPPGDLPEGDYWEATCPDYPDCGIPYCSVCNEFPPLDCEWPENPYCDCEVCDQDYDAVDVVVCDACGYDPCVCLVDFPADDAPPENLDELLDELQEIRDEVQGVFDAIFADPDQFPNADWEFIGVIYDWFYWDWVILDWLLEQAANPDNPYGVTWDDVLGFIDSLIGFWTYGYVNVLAEALDPSIGDYCYGCDDADCPFCFEQPGDEICPECGLPWEECEANDCLGQAVCDDCGQSVLECECFYCIICEAEFPGDCICEVACPCVCDCDLYADDAECEAGCCVCDEGPINDGPINDGPINDGPINDGPINDGPINDGPINDGPINDGPINDGPINDGPINDGPINDGPINDGPINDGPINDGPINDVPVNDEGCTCPPDCTGCDICPYCACGQIEDGCDCGPFECCPECCPICYPEEDEEEDKPASPQTGDAASAAPLVVSALMSISVFVGGTALKKKRD